MFNGIKVIDADGHVMEPNELYDQYLENKFKPDLEELKQDRRDPGIEMVLRIFPSAQYRTAAGVRCNR